MRNHLILLIFFTNILTVLAQDSSLDMRVNYKKQDVNLNQIFSDLENEYGIRFSYATQSLSPKKMNVDFQNDNIEDIVEYLLSDLDMEFKIVDKNVLVRKKESYKTLEDENYESSLHIRGKVTNKQQSETLDYALISVSNSNIGTYTNANGSFDIEIPTALLEETITIQYLGYESYSYVISELTDTYLLVPLSEANISMDEITIVNKAKPIKIGDINNGIIFRKGQIASKTSNVFGGDINRQMQLLPGITAHDDNSADIKIRGSKTDETLIILDGMPIYNPSHYHGIFSNVNTEYIDSVNIFKNSYPIQYGGRTAGLVELFSEKEVSKNYNVSATIDLLTSAIVANIPVTKNSSLSLAGRTTLKNIDNQQFNTENSLSQADQKVDDIRQRAKDQRSDPSSNFHDINAKYLWSSNRQNVQLNFFRSADKVFNEYMIDVSDNEDNGLMLNTRETQEWSTNAASLLYSLEIYKHLSFHSRTFASFYENDLENIIQLDKKYKLGPSSSGPNSEFAELRAKQDNSLNDIGIDNRIQYQKQNQKFELGSIITQHNLEYRFNENKQDILRGKTTFLEIGGYFNYGLSLTNKLNLNAGLRAIHYTNIDKTMFTPRLNANYKLSDKFTLKSSFAVEQQVLRQLDYEYRSKPMLLWISAGENDVPVLTSTNLMVGTTYRHKLLTLDIEIYNKDKTGELEYAVLTPINPNNEGISPRDYTLFEGIGNSKGIDFILSSGYKSYDTYLSYTLSKNVQQFEDIFNNTIYPSENDRRHQFKWINNLTVGKLTFGANLIYTSGLPYINISNTLLNSKITDTDPNFLRETLRAYQRVDMSVGYDIKVGNFNSNLTFCVFNIFNTQNVKYKHSVATNVRPNETLVNVVVGNETSLLNRTCNLAYNIKF